MSQALEKYLDRVMIFANRKESDAPQIRAELKDHLLKKIEDLEKQGLKHEDAIFQAIESHGTPQMVGHGLRPRFPLLDIRTKGTAKGVIAIGPKAVGVIAIGGVAVGIIAIGGMAIGLLTCAGFGLALMVSFSGFACAPIGLAFGGFALGFVAQGGFACGAVSSGGFALGLWVPAAGKAISYFNTETVPALLRQVGNFLSLKDHQSKVYFTTIAIIMYAILFGGITINGILLKKERSRIKKADPTLVE